MVYFHIELRVSSVNNVAIFTDIKSKVRLKSVDEMVNVSAAVHRCNFVYLKMTKRIGVLFVRKRILTF